MEILKTIPVRENVSHRVRLITFDVDEKRAIVIVEPDGENHKQVTIDVAPILAAATTTQRNIIIAFFKKVIAESVEIAEQDMPDILT